MGFTTSAISGIGTPLSSVVAAIGGWEEAATAVGVQQSFVVLFEVEQMMQTAGLTTSVVGGINTPQSPVAVAVGGRVGAAAVAAVFFSSFRFAIVQIIS